MFPVFCREVNRRVAVVILFGSEFHNQAAMTLEKPNCIHNLQNNVEL